jgi:hypothetical protein
MEGTGGHSCPGNAFWMDADLLFGWVQDANLLPLVSTSSVGTARTAAGVLGAPGATVLFGGRVNDTERPGFRLGAGYWFGEEQRLGIEASFLMLGSQATLFEAASNGTPILARPFFNANTSTQQSVLVAFPGVSSGAVDVRASSSNFYLTEIDFAEKVIDCGCFRLDTLLGYRTFSYDEGLRVRQVLAPTGTAFVPGTRITTVDDFNTANEFHGGDFGLRARFHWENLTLDWLAKAAVGNIDREIGISGGQHTVVPGVAPANLTGGVLALSSNIGQHGSEQWTVVPEFGVGVNWQMNSQWRLRLGYTILLLDRIARAADEVDFTVNPNLFPGTGQSTTGPSRPSFTLHRADIWVQTLNVGVEFSF